MAEFNRIPGSKGSKYPRRTFDGQEDQSYGFTQAYKLQTGTMRGQQQIGNEFIKINSEQRQFFVRNDETNQEGVFGMTPDGTIALVITKPGYRITDAITPD